MLLASSKSKYQINGVSTKFLVFSKIRNIFRVFTVLETVWENSVSRFRVGVCLNYPTRNRMSLCFKIYRPLEGIVGHSKASVKVTFDVVYLSAVTLPQTLTSE